MRAAVFPFINRFGGRMGTHHILDGAVRGFSHGSYLNGCVSHVPKCVETA